MIAELRLDPSIAFWTSTDVTIWPGVTIDGDVYCNGSLTNLGTLNSDVFVSSFTGTQPTGRQKQLADLSLVFPRIVASDFTSNYPVQSVSGSLSSQTLGPYSPARIVHCSGDLELDDNNRIEGMLIVEGDLTITGSSNVIVAGKNLPAVLITGDLIMDGSLTVEGLVVVDNQVRVNADAASLNVTGSIFAQDIFTEVITRIFFKSINFTKPLGYQPYQIKKLAAEGYQCYLDIPIWSTFFPFIKWIF